MWETLRTSLYPISDLFARCWPRLLATLVVLVGGWILARLLKAVIVRGLKLIKLDFVAEKAGIEAFLKKGGMKADSVEILGALVYWIALILFLIMALDIWKIDIGLSKTLLPFLPRVFAALVILILGLFVSSLVQDIVRTAAANAEIKYAYPLSKAVRWILIVFVVMTSVQQLELETSFISWGFLIILGSLGLGFALAIGLGAKDIVARKIGTIVSNMEMESKQIGVVPKKDESMKDK